MTKECEDVDALLAQTDTHFVFGHSSGGLIALEAALTLPRIHKVAVFEPPLSGWDEGFCILKSVSLDVHLSGE